MQDEADGTGGKLTGRVWEKSGQPFRPRIAPLLPKFSFEGWDYEVPPLGVAERRAKIEEELAAEREKEDAGRMAAVAEYARSIGSSLEYLPENENRPFPTGLDIAKEHRARAAWWRSVKNAGKDDWNQWEFDAKVAIDALLARGERDCDPRDNPAQQHLAFIARHLLDGLYALAANGIEPAAEILANVLHDAISDFDLLAYHKPELIEHWAQRVEGFPGLISPNSEITGSNERLVERLSVGKLSPLPILPTGKGGKPLSFKAPINKWAKRLFHFMERRRRLYMHLIENEEDLDALEQRIARLRFLTRETWESWAEVAWEIVMEATGGHPEQCPELKQLGESAAKKVNYKGNTHPEAQMRAKIKERLRQAFKLMAVK